MKKIIMIMLYCLLHFSLATAAPVATATFPPATPGFEYSGDMDMNYVHTTRDVQLTFMAALGLWFPYLAGDCNGDGEVNAPDAGAIFQVLIYGGTCIEPIPTPPAPLTPTPTPVPVPEQIMLTGSTGIGCPGELQQISVSIENPQTEVDCFGLHLIYDPEVLAYIEYEPGALDPGWLMIHCEEVEPGMLRACGFCIASPIPAGSSGNLLDITLQSTCDQCYWGETYPYIFNWRVDDLSGFYPVNGSFEVQCLRQARNGDTNLDHQMSSGDAQLAFMSVLGLVTLNAQQLITGDCNADDILTAEDAQLIFQTVLGLSACADPL